MLGKREEWFVFDRAARFLSSQTPAWERGYCSSFKCDYTNLQVCVNENLPLKFQYKRMTKRVVIPCAQKTVYSHCERGFCGSVFRKLKEFQVGFSFN